MYGIYDRGYTPTSYNEQSKSIQVSNNVCRLDIVEIEGQDPLEPRRWDEKRERDAYVLVYDTTSRRSFQTIRLLSDLTKHSQDAVIMLVGTKIDRNDRREVQQAEGMVLAQELGGSFSEVSALKKLGIDEMIKYLALLLLERKSNAKTQRSYFELETPQTSIWNNVCRVLLQCLGREGGPT